MIIILLAAASMPFVYAGSSTVAVGGDIDVTSYSHQRKLARTSDGALHTVYYKTNGTSKQIFYASSGDEGITWVEEQISFPPLDKDQWCPSIAVDSQDNIHVVWHGSGWGVNALKYNIQYRMRSPSGWQEWIGLTAIDQYQYDPSIAVDSEDNVHVAWRGKGWGTYTGHNNIQYLVKTSSGWQAQEGLTDVASDQSHPAIALDS